MLFRSLVLVLGTMAQPVFAGDLDPGHVVAAAGDMMPGCDDCPDGDAVQTACHACAQLLVVADGVPVPDVVTIRLHSPTQAAQGRATLPDLQPPRIAIM